MKFKKIFLFLLLLFYSKFCWSASIDGTTNISYQAAWSASDGDYARGFVCLSNGFSVPANASIILDIHVSVFGQINLNSTGKLRLISDLTLANGVTLASGGKIEGNNLALILNGDLTIPDDEILEITGNTIIDGTGHNLILGSLAQLMVDDNVTLTLRNLNFVNTLNTQNVEPIKLTSFGSKLALDNVTIKTVDDCYFKQGQFFIHNDVVFSGISKFIYQSTQPSFITSGSTLFFDLDTSFFYNPACTDKDLIIMQDRSSILYLNGCTLQATNTGLRLTTGKLFFDNSCTVSCNSNKILTSITELPGTFKTFSPSVRTVSWHPSGDYFAIGGVITNVGTDLRNYSFNGTSAPYLGGVAFSTGVLGVDWSPDGRYLAVGGNNGGVDDLIVYSFDGADLTEIISKNAGAGKYVRCVAWSPDGSYLAIGGSMDTADLRIYSFNGTSLTSITTEDFATNVYFASWSPDGRYLAVTGENDPKDLIVYSFNGSTLTEIGNDDFAYRGYECSWTPDGKYLAVGAANISVAAGKFQSLMVYSFNGTSLTLTTSEYFGDLVDSVSWSPDGKYLAAGGWRNKAASPPTIGTLVIYSFNGVRLKQEIAVRDIGINSRIYELSWSPDGTYLAVDGSNEDSGMCSQVYLNNYVSSTSGQSESTSIILGNSVLGENCDVDATVLSEANVNVDGYLNFDDAT